MIERNWLIINADKATGFSTADYGIWVFNSTEETIPARKYTETTIPGRSGTLVVDDERFPNVDIKFTCAIPANAQRGLEEFRRKLGAQGGYLRLESSFFPEYYRLGVLKRAVSVKTTPKLYNAVLDGLSMAKFELTFSCKPQRYLKSGEEEVRLTRGVNAIQNPTPYPAYPLLIFSTGGSVTQSGNASNRVQVNSITQPRVYVDCDVGEAYYFEVNLNRYVTMPNPFYIPGSFDGSLISSADVVMKTRWWTI